MQPGAGGVGAGGADPTVSPGVGVKQRRQIAERVALGSDVAEDNVSRTRLHRHVELRHAPTNRGATTNGHTLSTVRGVAGLRLIKLHQYSPIHETGTSLPAYV